MWHDVTAGEILRKYESGKRANPVNLLNTKERAHLRAEIEGVSPKRYGFTKDSSILERPRVVKALETILEEAGLSDKKLAKRIKEIIFTPKGANGDNTSHNAIRTVWQVKGKFAAEQHAVLHRSDMENLSDEQLDRIIQAGTKEISILKVKLGIPSVTSLPDSLPAQ